MITFILLLTLSLATPSTPTTPHHTKNSAPKQNSAPIVQKTEKGIMARNPVLFTSLAFAGTPVLMLSLGMQMWKWGDSTHFKASSDGWLERTQTHGGADKGGHLFSFYLGTMIFARYFEQIYPENRHKAALLGAAISTLGGLAVEIGDGFATNYGFSYTDIVADMLGVALALAKLRWPALDELVGLSVTLVFTDGFLSPHNKNRFDVVTNYSGQLTTLNLRLGGIPLINETLLKYFRIDLGYFTRCYDPYDPCSKERTGTSKWETRNLYVGLSLDLARMIRDHGVTNTATRALSTFSRYYNLFGIAPVGFNVDLNHNKKVRFSTSIPTP